MSSPARSFQRKKVCRFCIEKLEIDYKDINTMKGFLTERGKIIPRRLSGTCSRHQRGLAAAIKQGNSLSYLLQLYQKWCLSIVTKDVKKECLHHSPLPPKIPETQSLPEEGY